eukprot:COSAG02_NODE_43097_length_378_cov_0.734767_1_plen_50_part_10
MIVATLRAANDTNDRSCPHCVPLANSHFHAVMDIMGSLPYRYHYFPVAQQ